MNDLSVVAFQRLCPAPADRPFAWGAARPQVEQVRDAPNGPDLIVGLDEPAVKQHRPTEEEEKNQTVVHLILSAHMPLVD